jgi:hypothetical protein
LPPITYSTKGTAISQVSPGVFFYWVPVKVSTTGTQTFTITQGTTYSPTTGTRYFTLAAGSFAYDGSCHTLKTTISGGTANANAVTVTFSAKTTGTYYIGLKYSTGSIVGSGPAATTSVSPYAYLFQTANVTNSTSGLQLIHR